MITREQVADLQPGDVVEITDRSWPEGTVLRGPLQRNDDGSLRVGNTPVRYSRGEPLGFVYMKDHSPWSLTVVSRAPRPLYVNHDRTEPVPGDVVRDADSDHALTLFICSPNEEGDPWWVDTSADWRDRGDLPDRLRLLVDGETGQVVR